MTNLEYQQSRGLDHPFVTTPEQVCAEWARLYPERVERARLRRANPPKNPTPWSYSFQLSGEED